LEQYDEGKVCILHQQRHLGRRSQMMRHLELQGGKLRFWLACLLENFKGSKPFKFSTSVILDEKRQVLYFAALQYDA